MKDELGFFYFLADAALFASEPENLFFVLLTAATAGSGLSFSRAALFLHDERKGCLVGRMSVGPANAGEAATIWSKLAQENPSLPTLLSGDARLLADSPFNQTVTSISLPVGEGGIFTQVLQDGGTYLLARPYEKNLIPEVLEPIFLGPQVVVTPIPGRFANLGVMVGDNAFSEHNISERQIRILAVLATVAGNMLDRENIQQELKSRLEELQRVYHNLYETQHRLLGSEHLAVIGQAIAYITHEIRGAFSVIGGLAKIISRSSEDNPEVKNQSEIIYQKVVQLNRFLNRNLTFAILGEQKRKPCSPVELIKDTCNEILKSMMAEGQKTLFEIKQGLDPATPLILVDSEQMKHVFSNLIENSIHAIAERPDGEILLTSEWDNEFVQIKIMDNGVGISETDVGKIFEPFYTNRFGGSGLGLAFARQIIEAAKGRITCESRGKNMGTVFTISLPRN